MHRFLMIFLIIIVTIIGCSSSSAPSIPDVVDKVLPAVVLIETDYGYGSGVLISEDGYIVTNSHVIEGCEFVQAKRFFGEKPKLNSSETYTATVIGRNEIKDIAILKVDSDDLPKVAFGKAYDLELGETVIAIGFPEELIFEPTITLGIVSAVGYDFVAGVGNVQTDAAINFGNSGGPLFNLDGKVIGINTSTYANSDGLSFSIASEDVQEEISSLKEGDITFRPIFEPAEWYTYTSPLYDYSIEYPDEWDWYHNEFNETTIEDINQNVVVEIVTYDASDWTLDEWVDDDLSYYEDAFYFELISDETFEIQGVPAREISYIIETDKGWGKWQYRDLYILESDDTLHNLYCSCKPAQYREYEEAFDYMIENFTLSE